MEPFFYRNTYNYYSPMGLRHFPYRNKHYSNYAQNRINENGINEDKEDCKKDDTLNTTNSQTRGNSTDSPIFEIFGVKLFFDDILLISLIFFLYNEGVKDQSLFISLILLLLS